MSSAFNGQITERDAARLDVQFHDTIYQAAHHQRLSSAWEQIRLPAYWFMLSRNVASPDWRNATVSGHADIVRIIKTGQESLAAQTIREHITFAHERILQNYLNSVSEAAAAVAPETTPHPV
jgi:DNA-binding GntR family transcriptional regulator